MPTSTARKSSIGNLRRGPQKAHIPYRGDNPEVGKKTGIAVRHVQRKSDGFEPFEEVIQRADGLTPPQRRRRKKSLAFEHDNGDYDEEDGEQSMQIESPVQHLVNVRPPVTPSTIRRRSSIRPIPRASDVDFDQLPSPRVSIRNGVPRRAGLSRTPSYRDPDPPSHSPYRQPDLDDYGLQDGDSPGELPHDTSFSRIEQDDDDDDDEEREETPKPHKRLEKRKATPEDEEQEEEDPEDTPPKRPLDKGKGKAREQPIEQHDEAEDEIPEGPGDVEPESDSSRTGPPPKKAKKQADKQGKTTKSQGKKENQPEREGTRRSQRKPLKPLAYWRGERYVYGREDHHAGTVLVPPIKEVIRIPEEPRGPFSKKRKRWAPTTKSRSKSRAVEPVEEDVPPPLPVVNPEEGWDDETEAKHIVLHYTTREEVERRIVWTAGMVQPRVAAEESWLFDKIFGDDDFIAAGQLLIPVKGRKPSKAAKDNTYVFYVIEGAVNFKIHTTSTVVATGGMFMVPRGNMYMIENICNREAKLFFTQARKVEMDAAEIASKKAQAAALQQKRHSGRSSSVGPSSSVKRPLPNGRAASLAALPRSQ